MITKQHVFRDAQNPGLTICWCGNNDKELYFERCSRIGKVSGSLNARRFYGCIQCGRVINPRTLEVVGQNRRLIVGRNATEPQQFEFLGELKSVEFWPVGPTEN